MKEQIYTIPVNDGFNESGECAFCNMRNKLEKDALAYTLGPSYMEQDVRDMTNEKGFCRTHYEMMYKAQNRLGLALMVSTHMRELEKKVKSAIDDVKNKKKSGLFSHKSAECGEAERLLAEINSSCFVCDKINASMERYFDTFFYLWRRSEEFQSKVKASTGFCAEHALRLVSLAGKKLGGKEYDEFLDELERLQSESFGRVEEELLWFINKFDYRFKDKPWGNSKTALRRAIVKTAAFDAELESNETEE